MASVLTIRNLDETVKQQLRIRAAINGRSMEAEVREILAREVSKPAPPGTPGKFRELVGVWKGRMTTDEVMDATRGE